MAFTGAYHGLGYGALNATHRAHFRAPFRSQLGEFGRFRAVSRSEAADLPRDCRAQTPQTACRRERFGAVLVEPIQARGGINVPPPGFLPLLRRLCDEHRRVADSGRNLHRLWPHGKMVRLRAQRDGAGFDLPGQGADGRISALGVRRARGHDGRRLAAFDAARPFTPARFRAIPSAAPWRWRKSTRFAGVKLPERSAALGRSVALLRTELRAI